MASVVDDLEKPKSKRLFINSVDLYQGQNLAKYLSNCVVGVSAEEGEEEEEDAKSIDSGIIPPPKEGCYEIIATLKNKDAPKPDFVKEIINYQSKEQLYEHLFECDVIVYDITEDPDEIDEATWAVSQLHSDLDKIDSQKMFILISTVLTWARSKPLDPDDPEIPFTEDDYRRRKAHPNFKDHISAEKTVIKLGKTNKAKLVTFVVASGLTYGAGESIFHYMFKAAWHNTPELLCFGNGQNVIPTLHIKDLGGVIQNIADSRPKVRYIVAVDDSQNTLEEIVKSVSQNLGTGKIQIIPQEEALLDKDIKQADFDMLLVDLRMDAVFVKENMRIQWVAETGIVENIQNVVKEYRETRKLLPVRAAALGPPAAGKSTVVKALCDHYKLHHIKIKDVIDEAMELLEKSAARADAEEEEDDDGKAAEDQELLDQINESKEQNGNRIDDQFIIRFFKEKLHSMPCQNQGFILDGFPKTLEHAKELFAAEDEEEAEESASASFDKAIMPENVFVLEANDEFLKNRVMNLPESVVAGTHNTEDGLTRRLADYRAANTEDETVLNYFDELEIHPDHIDVMKDSSEMMHDTVERMKKVMGEPRNYGPTIEEQEEMRRQEEEAQLKREADEKAEKERQETEEAAERKHRQEEWGARLDEVKREEYELLETQSIPLRNYLMKHVMPTLTKGLIDCCKVRPDDAIDYLAEYLFQHNPQVD
ncbi:adenylate kinase 7-like [Tubulanus polymorphus]|uniref:adenylate kinase 7-like n=1 Tax=Tubulanus polymorphus TaxID=672921 RepID=UPI003DA2AEFE